MYRTKIILIIAGLLMSAPAFGETGVTDSKIVFGSVLALKGKAKGLGEGIKKGMTAAFKGVKTQGRSIELVTENDFYEPSKAIEGTKKLVKRGIFLMIGNVGTPTAKVTLPVLAEAGVPAVGFFTGAGLLRPGSGPVINYRASYIQETSAVIDAAISNGLKPGQICAYVQNDAYGMAGLTGVNIAMKKAGAARSTLDSYKKLIAMKGTNPKRNNVGPVGVYRRNTTKVKPGYNSLKAYEKKSGNQCKLVVTVGAYSNIAHFARNAKANGERWIISAVSFTGADNLANEARKYKAQDRIVMTQTVPLLNSNAAIVKEAKAKLGEDFGFVSLEGYIVGKMTLKILDNVTGELTRKNFVAQAKKSKFSLGGVEIDFTRDGNQGSNLVVVSYLSGAEYREATPAAWKQLVK